MNDLPEKVDSIKINPINDVGIFLEIESNGDKYEMECINFIVTPEITPIIENDELTGLDYIKIVEVMDVNKKWHKFHVNERKISYDE